MMRILSVLPLKKGIYKDNLTYFSAQNIEIGSIVTIEIRNKRALGLVLASEELNNIKESVKSMSFKLKKVVGVKKDIIFRKEFIDSIVSLNKYFISKNSNSSGLLIPHIFQEKYDEISKIKNAAREMENMTKKDSNMKDEKLIFQASLEDRISYYKTLIRGNFANKKSIFIIFPTEHDLDIFYKALSKGIESFTFSLSGELSSKKIIESYKRIVESSHPLLILGTAQFLSIPIYNLGMIIVENEGSPLYRQIPKPHFDLVIFAEIYASKIRSKFMLSDTILRIETIARKENHEVNEVRPLSYRINPDEINIVVSGRSKSTGKFKIFEEKTIEQINNSLSNGKKILVFSLRKGLATETRCGDCGEIIICDKCFSPLVLYSSSDGKKRIFACNRCNEEKDPGILCKYCQSWNLIPLGIGADRVFDEAKNLFNETRIYRLDKNSVKSESEAKKIVTQFEDDDSSILVATEMAFYYMNNKADLSVISSFDSLWSIPNFRMGEKIIRLLISLIAITKKTLIIQTKNENDLIIQSAKSGNLLQAIRDEQNDRKLLNYPPYKRFIKIAFYGKKSENIKTKIHLENYFKKYDPVIFTACVNKENDEYCTSALLKIDPKKWSLPEISHDADMDLNLEKLLSSLPQSFDIIVDPMDLF